MPYSLQNHPYFLPWTDLASGIQSFLLNEHIAPVQMVIYFVNPAISGDEKWLWFVALGDMVTGEVRVLKE